MHGPGGSRSKPTRRERVIGWVMVVLGVPIMVLLPLACLGMPIDGIGYLTGFGEAVEVSVTTSSDGAFRVPLQSGDAGEGYYRYQGESVKVTAWGVTKGDTVDARLAITSELGRSGDRVYVTGWTAFWDAMWGGVFMLGAFMIGRTLFTTGREVKS